MKTLLDRLTRLLMPMAALITALLWLQWPLREAGSTGSLLANDLAQSLFALYVAAALRHAGARGAHLVARPDLAAGAADVGGALGRLRRHGAAWAVLPWSLYLLLDSAPQVAAAMRTLERYPETQNPGYFLVKLALTLAALGLLLQAVLDLAGRPGTPR